MKGWTAGERKAVRGARIRISLITAGFITLVVMAVGLVSDAVMRHAQDEQVWRDVRFGAALGDPVHPPVCTWLFVPGFRPLANAPDGFPLGTDLETTRRSGEAVERTVRRNHTVYLVRTQVRRDGQVVQAVFDMRYQLADRTHLWYALGVAELLGLLASVATGVVLGRVSVAPLAEALIRQRRFVADASHELRTPVTQAFTRVQMLSNQAAAAGLPAGHREGLARLTGSLGQLGDILDDLLLSACLTGGPSRPAECRPVDLAALARSVAEETEPVTVTAPPGPLWVNGVETALRRSVGELLSNAVRHAPGARVEVALVRQRGMVELTVSDSGPGFAPDEGERLFERFHSNGEGGRYGLGLALLREVVTHHGGTVTADGQPGKGARFTIRLPECEFSAM
ncbi:Adaptive-response sensory-kinase SasA [Streptomyces sp. RB5]|uniref:histidine kinase n=1 Tax=Streptomyces smaragdinus TaxID=2585196 RepID=A0A7K0CCC8_9ACTN|nr:HAMP domain-containing sensor histidine kinase [Streptomyces smaragdinus]MQY11100.1 Adaptive-response sensory-kinase SasA [Streptomyces smaragdinus]